MDDILSPDLVLEGAASGDASLFANFVLSTTWQNLPERVRGMAARCLLDLIGVGISGRQTRLSAIISSHAVRHFGAGAEQRPARILFDGRRASPVGAALAGGMIIDSFDAHDGHVLTKGHAGCAILPGLAALVEGADQTVSGVDFLTHLVIGYEVAIRAGIAQHRIAPDYHTSGAWNALGVAAIAARIWGLDQGRLREAIGIAEYHGPRSQMMRCIDFPTMVKDGSGWGAMAGLSAAYLAADGFTGAPALVVEDDRVADLWADLGQRWRILELYFKPHPVCRWAQPAIEAVLTLRQEHDLAPEHIAEIEIATFHNAVRLGQFHPATTEAAQYSLPFPVAVAMVNGTLRAADITDEGLSNPAVAAMAERIRLVEDAAIEARFPAERLARARITLADGRVLQGKAMPARGDAERPLSDDEIMAKFHDLCDGLIGIERAEGLVAAVAELTSQASVARLMDMICQPAGAEASA